MEDEEVLKVYYPERSGHFHRKMIDPLTRPEVSHVKEVLEVCCLERNGHFHRDMIDPLARPEVSHVKDRTRPLPYRFF